ncbi:DUF3310 domain-containing protein [Clostridium paraputrificum]|uniref:DUF3310 domain-containing protein n=1 Tax=Clostridium paraputrificum TaxID=29363 RepID=UPI001A9A39DC|nr:DUF3310 domain-containing protein [Clostridium paraputrificum]
MTLEEFKEYAQTVTRAEFFYISGGNFDGSIEIAENKSLACPGALGLLEDCGEKGCKQCWREAVKDIKFKDDIEKDFIEAINKQPIIVSDSVNHPSHYTHGEIETIDKIEDVLGLEGFQAYCVGNAIKYLDRYKLKNGFEDIKKAKRYLEFYIEKTEGKNE